MLEVTPVEVSLCTTHTALIWCRVSARRRVSIKSACTPRRQPSMPGRPMNSGFKSSASAIFFHSVAKWPVSYINTVSPGLNVLLNDDRKSVESGKSVSVRVDLGGGRILKKKQCTNVRKMIKTK